MFGKASERPGLFVTLEGCDGAGKSTQLKRIRALLDRSGVDCVITREPGGTPIGEMIRNMILCPHCPMDLHTEALLYAASRAELVRTVISPALEANKVVVCERYVDSSIVYQGIAGGLGVDQIVAINNFAIQGIMPDVTFLLDLDPKVGLLQRSSRKDRIERRSLEYHLKVRNGFLELAARNPGRFVVVDASMPEDVVWSNLHRVLREVFLRKNVPFVDESSGGVNHEDGNSRGTG